MVFLEKRTNFFECFMDIPDFKTYKVIKIEFNKQIMDRCDSKTEFRDGGARNSVFAKISIVVEWAMAFLEKKSVF